jgi:DNA-binding transcriptional regulator YdaS (Cro superfamily)
MMKDKYRMALLRACYIAGGQKQLAEKIKVNPSRLNKWINRSKGSLPLQFALAIENATSGQVTCRELAQKWEGIAQCKQDKNETNDMQCSLDVDLTLEQNKKVEDAV